MLAGGGTCARGGAFEECRDAGAAGACDEAARAGKRVAGANGAAGGLDGGAASAVGEDNGAVGAAGRAADAPAAAAECGPGGAVVAADGHGGACGRIARAGGRVVGDNDGVAGRGCAREGGDGGEVDFGRDRGGVDRWGGAEDCRAAAGFVGQSGGEVGARWGAEEGGHVGA